MYAPRCIYTDLGLYILLLYFVALAACKGVPTHAKLLGAVVCQDVWQDVVCIQLCVVPPPPITAAHPNPLLRPTAQSSPLPA